MIISLHINDSDVNQIGGTMAGQFTLQDFKKNPQWFVDVADRLDVVGTFGTYSEDK